MTATAGHIDAEILIRLGDQEPRPIATLAVPVTVTHDPGDTGTLHVDQPTLNAALAAAFTFAATELAAETAPAPAALSLLVTIAGLAERVLTLIARQPVTVLLTGPNQDEAVRRLNALALELPAELIGSVSRVNGAEQIRLKDGTRIRAHNRRSRIGLRGSVYDLIVIDELTSRDFIDEARPAMATRDGAFMRLTLDSGETIAACSACDARLAVTDPYTTLQHGNDGSHIASQRLS